MVTSAFTHASLVHLALNMLALLLFGSELERTLGKGRYLDRLPGVRPRRGRRPAAASAPTPAAWSVPRGRSTACSVPSASCSLRQKQDLRGLLTLLAINLVISFLPGVSLLGHLGGLVAGAVTAVVLLLAGRRRVPAVAGVAVLVAVLLVLTFGGLR